jgi:hypothetical protein
MSGSEVFGIGRAAVNPFHAKVPSGSRTARRALPVPPANSSLTNLQLASTVQAAAKVAIDQARARLRIASTALADAFHGLPRQTITAPASAMLNGLGARVQSTLGRASVLATTQKINAQTSTDRSSTTALGLDVTSAQLASTLSSTAEMNTAATSLSAHDLTFQNSTSHAQLSGSYSGSATSLTLKIAGAADISDIGSIVSFDVLDEGNHQVATYTGTVTAGQVIDVGSTGLKVRFTAGSFANAKQATTNVSQTATDVSSTALFDAGWGSAPLFENFQQVTAGSFTVNSTTIAVNANDSIASVISRINGSGAGVTAALSGDRITLSTNAYSEDAIVLANDTSGFLAATKLSGATTTRGNVRDDQQVLSKTSQFGGVARRRMHRRSGRRRRPMPKRSASLTRANARSRRCRATSRGPTSATNARSVSNPLTALPRETLSGRSP